MNIILQGLPANLEQFVNTEVFGGFVGGAVVTVILAFFILFIILTIALYIYTSFAYMALAKKTKTEPAWLAWIPIANLYLHSKMAGMHWWPVLLIIVGFIPVIGFIGSIVLAVYVFIWGWKIFEKVGKPGWWVLFAIVPIIGQIIFLILLGIAAWGDNTPTRPTRSRR